MIRAEIVDGKIYTEGSGDMEELMLETDCLIQGLKNAIREKTGSETEYAMRMMQLMGIVGREKAAIRAELDALAESAEDADVRQGLAEALAEADEMGEDREKMRQRLEELKEKYPELARRVEAAEDARDPEKVIEMEEALKRRMMGE